MDFNIIGKHHISYEDFNYLLVCDRWLINKRMKDNWSPQDHLEYIDNVFNFNSYVNVDFYIDNTSLRGAHTIDVFITPSGLEQDITHKPHHIQFIKDYRENN